MIGHSPVIILASAYLSEYPGRFDSKPDVGAGIKEF
jgi:hypothetical protein